MRRIIEPLSQMNAKIEATDNHAPLQIFGKNPLQAITYKLPVSSAQVKSCVLLAGLNANGKSKVLSPKSKVQIPTSRNHTELMLKYLGAEIEEDFIEIEDGFSHQVIIDGNSKLTAKDFDNSIRHFFSGIFYCGGGVFERFGNYFSNMLV